MYNSIISFLEYTTFLSLPVNATQVHIVNRAPLFTHMGVCCYHLFDLDLCSRWNRTKAWLLFVFVSAAVMVGNQYIVSGRNSMSLNITYPSSLDDNHLEYRLHLTPDILPEMEELLLPGPLQEEINIQVRRDTQKCLINKLWKVFCRVVGILCAWPGFYFAGLSQIWKRIWRENQSKHWLSVLHTYQKQQTDKQST